MVKDLDAALDRDASCVERQIAGPLDIAFAHGVPRLIPMISSPARPCSSKTRGRVSSTSRMVSIRGSCQSEFQPPRGTLIGRAGPPSALSVQAVSDARSISASAPRGVAVSAAKPWR